MIAHVLLNLLNKLGKRDKMRGLPSILSLFCNEFNKFNNTRARMLDSIHHMIKSHFCRKNVIILSLCTRGIWKVLSMVFYLSNRFTNLIMFGIILKNYLSSTLWHKFHEDIIMQTRKI